jgi:chitin deacetylase
MSSGGFAHAVSLTFDDGPGPSTTRLLDVLARHGTKATFFVLGANLEQRFDVAVQAVREGHVLGNHTYSHARPGALAAGELEAEIARTDALLATVYREAGRVAPVQLPLRLPYGPAVDDSRRTVLAALGRAHVHWTADFADWTATDPIALAIALAAHVREQHGRGEGAILDLHDSSRVAAERTVTVEAVNVFLGGSAP